MNKARLALAGLICIFSCQSWAAGADKPRTKVEILAPANGAVLKGCAEVCVKITPPEGRTAPSVARFGFGGAPWMEMVLDASGQWKGSVDTALLPNGSHVLTVLTDDPRARAAVTVKTENPLRIFFADLHSHTAYSDGTLMPSYAHEYARDKAELDVFSLTDHLERIDESEWIDARTVAEQFNEDGKFVTIVGLEWTKKWGHVNLFDPKARTWPEDPAKFYDAIAAAGVVAKFNHPGDGTKSHGGLVYSEAGDKAIQMMEVRGTAEEKAFLRALAFGWHIAPDGSTDTHGPYWGNAATWTGILAPGLSKRCIWDALKNRHTYSTRDRNCKLRFSVNGAPMGTIVTKPAPKAEVVVNVEDPDAHDTIAKIELFENGEVVETCEPAKNEVEWKVTCDAKPGKSYYFVKVTQTDGNPMWSAPVWLEPAAE